jgi:hypothetical protein
MFRGWMIWSALICASISCASCQGEDGVTSSHDGSSAITTPTSPRLVRHGNVIELTTYGSGTCPFTIGKVEAMDATTVRLVLDIQTAKPCSADIKPHSEVVKAPTGVDQNNWTSASLEFPGRDPVRVRIT